MALDPADGPSPGPLASGPEPAGRLAVAAIVRNEGPYLLEWVAHHRALGVERFFIADNDSTDETTATLAALAAAGIVRHLPFPTVPGRAPQYDAYAEILRRFGAEADWIAFLDADEFLVPAPPFRSLAATLAAVLAAARAADGDGEGGGIGAVAVNWAIYGSAGHRRADSRPVTVRFPRRARRPFPTNRHYKSIVRPDAVGGAITSPHRVPVKPGYRTIQADGAPLADLPGTAGLSARILWSPLRINHYVVKSWDEFCYHKRARGRATGVAAPRRAAYFAAHDRNEVPDPMPIWLVHAAGAESRRIEAVLRAAAPRFGDIRGVAPGGREAGGWRARLAALLRPPAVAGAVETVELHGALALVRGWAVARDGAPATAFRVTLAGATMAIASLVRIRRCDIVARRRGAALACGFVLRVAWPPEARPGMVLAVEACDARGRGRILPAAGAAWHRRPPPLPQPHLAGDPAHDQVPAPVESFS